MVFSVVRLTAASLTSGSLSALVGLGGGFVLTPLLTSTTAIVKGGLKHRNAQATVLASIAVSSAGAAGGYIYAKSSNNSNPSFSSSSSPSLLYKVSSNPKVLQILHDSALISLAGVCFSPLGVRIARTMNNDSLRKLMGWTMIFVGPTVPGRKYIQDMLDPPSSSSAAAALSPLAPPPPQTLHIQQVLPPLLIGSLSGLLAGLLGVGGGAITVPLISLLHASTPNYHYTDALATSLLAMPLPAVIATIAQRDLVSFPIAAVLAVGSTLGGGAMARCVEQIGKDDRENVEKVLRWGFCGLMWVLGARFVK
ncbi:hypothetical protein ScalyP_jg11517 [Parmales sp. scaly parma]|nr:hypothetical protein ScalyP_jg11517 [Parmales sp. scaly parma]